MVVAVAVQCSVERVLPPDSKAYGWVSRQFHAACWLPAAVWHAVLISIGHKGSCNDSLIVLETTSVWSAPCGAFSLKQCVYSCLNYLSKQLLSCASAARGPDIGVQPCRGATAARGSRIIVAFGSMKRICSAARRFRIFIPVSIPTTSLNPKP